MTTRYEIQGDMWAGEHVAIFGNGPEMSIELADQFAHCKTIAVNRALRFAPDADMFIALDPSPEYWDDIDEFDGLKICGIETDAIDALYVGMMYETVRLPGIHSIEIRNNALAAIRIAMRAGAKKISLVGFDAEKYDNDNEPLGFCGFAAGIAQIIAECRANGIEVITE